MLLTKAIYINEIWNINLIINPFIGNFGTWVKLFILYIAFLFNYWKFDYLK